MWVKLSNNIVASGFIHFLLTFSNIKQHSKEYYWINDRMKPLKTNNGIIVQLKQNLITLGIPSLLS